MRVLPFFGALALRRAPRAARRAAPLRRAAAAAQAADPASAAGPDRDANREARLVAAQLGYTVPNLLRVASWALDGTPGVIATYPLKRERDLRIPFPTAFWLTNPILAAAVARLESGGGVAAARIAVNADDATMAALREAHERYKRRRWALLTPEDRDIVFANGWDANLRDVGVAGLRDPTKVKCLHAHYAHFLGDPEAPRNPIGAWVHEQLPPNVRVHASVQHAET